MRTPAQISADADERAPFANGFEWDHWSNVWCDRCSHYDDCPIILVALHGRTPAEWTNRQDNSLIDRYQCTEFEPSKGKLAVDDPVVQGQLARIVRGSTAWRRLP